MADCTSDPTYLRQAAERAMSRQRLVKHRDDLMRECGPAYWNEQGRQNDLAKYTRLTEIHARKLIWC